MLLSLVEITHLLFIIIAAKAIEVITRSEGTHYSDHHLKRSLGFRRRRTLPTDFLLVDPHLDAEVPEHQRAA